MFAFFRVQFVLGGFLDSRESTVAGLTWLRTPVRVAGSPGRRLVGLATRVRRLLVFVQAAHLSPLHSRVTRPRTLRKHTIDDYFTTQIAKHFTYILWGSFTGLLMLFWESVIDRTHSTPCTLGTDLKLLKNFTPVSTVKLTKLYFKNVKSECPFIRALKYEMVF